MMRIAPLLLAPALLLLAAAPAHAKPFAPTMVNGDERGATIRFDVDGAAHDREIQRFGGRYRAGPLPGRRPSIADLWDWPTP